MVEFNIQSIKITKNNLEALSHNISAIDSEMSRMHSHYIYQLESALSRDESLLIRANKEIELANEGKRINYEAANRIYHEIKDLEKERDAVNSRPAETDDDKKRRNQEVQNLNNKINELWALRSRIHNWIDRLDSVITRIGFAKDKINSHIGKCKKTVSELNSIYYDLRTIISRADMDIRNAISGTDRALKAVNGVFTSCKVESHKVLVNYKGNLMDKISAISFGYSSFESKIAQFKTNLQNADFADAASSQSAETLMGLSAMSQSLERQVQKLDIYISALREYEKC